jgi:hypothetical protein
MKIQALAGAVALVAGTAANAEVVLVNSLVTGLTDFSSTANLPQFDPALGTLQSVEFTARASISGAFNFTNVAGSGKRTRIDYIDWDVKVTAFGGPTGNVISFDWKTAPTTDEPFGVAPGHFNTGLSAPILAGNSQGPINYGGTYNGGGTYTSADSVFASFIGSSTVPIDVAVPVLFGVTIFGSGQYNWTLNTNATLEVSAAYTYVVPAPASAGLLLVAGLSASRRRRA